MAFERAQLPMVSRASRPSARSRSRPLVLSSFPQLLGNQATQRILRSAAPEGKSDSGAGAAASGPKFSPECNSFHRCSVIEPLVHARQLVNAVLSELPPIAAGTVMSGRIIDLLNVHFHTASAVNATTILDRFRAIRAELDAPVRYVCHQDDPSDCESTGTGFVGGFTTCASGADINLCSMYYVGLTCEEQARALVHEAAHHVAGICADHAYVGDSRYMALTPAQAMGNADTYAQFAKMVFRGAASCVDCGFEIQRRGRRY